MVAAVLGIEYGGVEAEGDGEVMKVGDGGSCMVKVGFFGFFPIAVATRVLNFEDVELSLDLDEPIVA